MNRPTEYERLFRISSKVIRELLNDCDRTILEYLYGCPSNLDYLAKISKATCISYMTTKRAVKKLTRVGLVRACENSNFYSYFRLTEFGMLLVESFRGDRAAIEVSRLNEAATACPADV